MAAGDHAAGRQGGIRVCRRRVAVRQSHGAGGLNHAAAAGHADHMAGEVKGDHLANRQCLGDGIVPIQRHRGAVAVQQLLQRFGAVLKFGVEGEVVPNGGFFKIEGLGEGLVPVPAGEGIPVLCGIGGLQRAIGCRVDEVLGGDGAAAAVQIKADGPIGPADDLWSGSNAAVVGAVADGAALDGDLVIEPGVREVCSSHNPSVVCNINRAFDGAGIRNELIPLHVDSLTVRSCTAVLDNAAVHGKQVSFDIHAAAPVCPAAKNGAGIHGKQASSDIHAAAFCCVAAGDHAAGRQGGIRVCRRRVAVRQSHDADGLNHAAAAVHADHMAVQVKGDRIANRQCLADGIVPIQRHRGAVAVQQRLQRFGVVRRGLLHRIVQVLQIDGAARRGGGLRRGRIPAAALRHGAVRAADGAAIVHGTQGAGRFTGADRVFRRGGGLCRGGGLRRGRVPAAALRDRFRPAADGAIGVHGTQGAGRFAGADRAFLPVPLGKGQGREDGQHHAQAKQDTENSFLHHFFLAFYHHGYPRGLAFLSIYL